MDKYRDFFHDYVAGYDPSLAPIWRKHEHTIRVTDNCLEIGKSLQFRQCDMELAELTGLFHDIGRFEQWHVYQSFRDYGTIDHAELGIQVIKDIGIFAGHPDYDILLSAIYNHNKFHIDHKITDDRELTFCKLIRDADKLDIIRELTSGIIKVETTKGICDQDAIKEVVHHHLVDRHHYKSEDNDNLAILALFNDIYFDYTKKCIRDEFLIEKITERVCIANPKQADIFRSIEKAIKKGYY